MPIPAAQLNTWRNQGGTVSSSLAYDAINRALTGSTSPLRTRKIDIFLQGSYRNHTNIHGDSDIDVVCLFDGTLVNNRHELPPNDQQLIPNGSPAAYAISDLTRDVLASLKSAFGVARIREGSRAIKVNTGYGREADVIPAIRYVHYYRQLFSPALVSQNGIALWSGNRWIYNFPLQHIANGESKNGIAQANGNYKSAIRLFKNARNRAVERGFITDADAPSYFIEGMLYNVPDHLFTANASDTFVNVFNHLNAANLAGLMSQNGIIPLTGGSSTQWPLDTAQRYLTGLHRLWNEWQ